MEISLHIERIEAECNLLETEGHLEQGADIFVAVTDLLLALAKLKQAVKQRNGQREREQ